MTSRISPAARMLGLALGLLAMTISLALAAEPASKSAKPEPAAPSEPASYVGSQACRECHPGEHANFKAYSKKARSFQSVLKMVHGLTEAELKKCYECHTTGYGRPGGFVSQAQTPNLAEVGCETCHGPASRHVVSQSRKDIRDRVSTKDCDACHNSERIAAFNFKPMIHSGAH